MSDAARSDHRPAAGPSSPAQNHPAALSPEDENDPDVDTDPATNPETRLGKLVYTKRKEFLGHLLRSIDSIVYFHFSYLYLLDCSFFRFTLSCMAHFYLLTPKPIALPPPPHHRQTIIGIVALIVYNILCHVFSPAPSASERLHGYLHGGLIIDFVGQKGPTSKVRLVANDLVVLALQSLMLGLTVIQQEIPNYSVIVGDSAAPQDAESEERGERRRVYNLDGTVREDGYQPVGVSEEEEEARQKSEMERKSFQITSGEFEVARVDVAGTVRSQWQKGRTLQAAGGVSSSSSAGSSTAGVVARVAMVRHGRAWRFGFSNHPRNRNAGS